MAEPAADPADMSGQYNTKLSPAEETAFAKWQADLTQREGRDTSGDLRDYDQRGLFKELGGKLPEPGHGPDTFKKPSHPTFSDESKYHGKDGNEGGKWKDLGNGKFSYEASKTNLKYYSPEGLQRYFNQVEPDVKLAMPEGVQ